MNIEKVKAAACKLLNNTLCIGYGAAQAEYLEVVNAPAVIELIKRLEAAELELNLLKPDPLCDIGCMLSCSMEGVARLEAAERDAALFRCIRELCGYVENGSDTTFSMFQDDATKYWTVKVGNRNYDSRTIEVALEKAMKEKP